MRKKDLFRFLSWCFGSLRPFAQSLFPTSWAGLFLCCRRSCTWICPISCWWRQPWADSAHYSQWLLQPWKTSLLCSGSWGRPPPRATTAEPSSWGRSTPRLLWKRRPKVAWRASHSSFGLVWTALYWSPGTGPSITVAGDFPSSLLFGRGRTWTKVTLSCCRNVDSAWWIWCWSFRETCHWARK